MRIRWLKGAIKNLEQAIAFIAHENPQAAERVASRIYEAVHRLADYPLLGKENPEIEGIRDLVLPEYRYVIRYSINAEEIRILRIHHTSQLWPTSQ